MLDPKLQLLGSRFPFFRHRNTSARPDYEKANEDIEDSPFTILLKRNSNYFEFVGQWCVVEYDKQLYPGIINTCDDGSGYEVSVMHPIRDKSSLKYSLKLKYGIRWKTLI